MINKSIHAGLLATYNSEIGSLNNCEDLEIGDVVSLRSYPLTHGIVIYKAGNIGVMYCYRQNS